MKKSPSRTLEIVFIGSDLDPKSVTETLGIEPTDSYEKGFQKKINGKQSKPRGVGMWCYKVEIKSCFEEELENLLKMFGKLSVQDIRGVDRASLHIYLGLSNDESVIESTFDCVISPTSLTKIQKMGLDVRITVN